MSTQLQKWVHSSCTRCMAKMWTFSRQGGGGGGRDGDRSLFRRSIVSKVRCSEGSMFRRSVVPKVHCSEASLLRRFVTAKLRFIVPKTRFNIPKKEWIYMENNCFLCFLRNSWMFLDLHKRSWADPRYNFIGRAVVWDPAVQPQYKLARYVGL